MLGLAAVSEAPLSSEAGPATAQALFAIGGAGALSATGSASTNAVFAASGAGIFSVVGAAIGTAAFSLAGAGAFAALGAASTGAAFSIHGAAAFTAYGEPIYRTPTYRTAVVPRINRVLVLAARNRIQDVPSPSRVEMVIASPPRLAMVPALGNTIEA